MAAKRKASNIFVWIILGLLFVGLAGFGIGGFGGSVTSVARVGDAEIGADEYARALRAQQQRIGQAMGEPLTLDQMRALGIDRQVIEGLIATAALEHEAGRMGLSVGDDEVARRILAVPAFQGAGGFDREAYAFTLRRSGLNEAQFEEDVRAEAAREILQAAVLAAVEAPDAYVEAMAAWAGERRDATVMPVGTDRLEGEIAPDAAELRAFYGENAARFAAPERRRVTYAAVTAAEMAERIRVPASDIESLYVARSDLYARPARVLAERLAFADRAAAEAAARAIAAGETSFDALVAERGLTLEDVDQGELAAADLGEEAARAVFALDEPGIAGPVDTDLGPALYRVNALLAPNVTPLGEVRDALRRELAEGEARRALDGEREPVDDLLASGATVEEIAAESALSLGALELEAGAVDGTGLAGDAAFRAAAEAAGPDDFPELIDLADGGLAVLRLDEVIAPATPPLEEIRAEVERAWQASRRRDRLAARAEALAERLRAGETPEELGLAPVAARGLARGEAPGEAPEAASEALFAAAQGDVLALPGDATRAWILRVDAVRPADAADAELAAQIDAFRAQARRDVAGDLFEAYGRAVQEEAGLQVDQAAIQAVQAQLLGP
jgi:peptidyl-prolyl cis-trans isomerase D